jgi:hypothetical protein
MIKKSDYRLRVSRPSEGGSPPYVTYIVRKGDRVFYMSRDETPLALSNLIQGDAASVRFALEDALDGGKAAAGLRIVLAEQWQRNRALTPAVEVLP